MANYKLDKGKWIKDKDKERLPRCKICKHKVKMGFKLLATGKVQRYQCKVCGSVSY